MMLRHIFCVFTLIALPFLGEAKLPEIDGKIVNSKFNEIMRAHASYKKFTPELAKRSLVNFAEELDPTKTYFIESDLQKWLNPSDELLNEIITDFNNNSFKQYEAMAAVMDTAIERRRELDKQVHTDELPTRVNPDEFKDMKWAKSEQELLDRLIKIRALQVETTQRLTPDLRQKALQRLDKRQTKTEEDLLSTDAPKKEQLILSKVLKALASSLDTHTAYFTPDEATQFMINVQQRLFGIGAQLRDDLNGFTVIKIIEGGPAANSKQLKLKDRIVAVNGEPVVGMDIIDAVDLIRGEENTPVNLTVIREVGEGKDKKEEIHEVTITRGEVVLKESRYEISYDPYGDGVIAYLKLFSFYQDPESSSAGDLTNELEKLKSEHKVLGVILDLRYNSGGMLSQAVAVAGMFITKGVVVSIKDDTGTVQHLRDIDGKTVWNGPLIVLINRASASASEIVAQTLQDYGRALIVGDDHSYGKGSFQTFTLNADKKNSVNSQGEYKVTRGRYYTVSGKSPQLIGVISDIVVPGPLSESEIGEKFAKYPLETDHIKENFDDDLMDVPAYQRDKIASLYKFNLQPKMTVYNKYMDALKRDSKYRLDHNSDYQNFLVELKKKDIDVEESDAPPTNPFGQNDLQLQEAYSIMKDLIIMMMLGEPKAEASPLPAAGPIFSK